MDIAPSKKLPVLLQNASAERSLSRARHAAYLERLAGLEHPPLAGRRERAFSSRPPWSVS